MSKYSHKRGVLLLLSILITSVVLTIALSLASITNRQLALVSGAKESTKAFYAADAGADCALYWDLNYYDQPQNLANSPFPIPPGTGYVLGGAGKMYCYGKDLLASGDWNYNPSQGTASFSFNLDPTNQTNGAPVPCASVFVRKTWTDTPPAGDGDGVVDPGEVTTVITSTGYSTCDTTNPRRALRVVEQSYK